MTSRLGTYISHHAGDPLRSGSLFTTFVKRGRDVIEGVANWGGRKGAGVKWQTGGLKTESVAVVARSPKPAVILKNIWNGLISRSHPDSLVSKFSPRFTPQPYWSTFRSYEQFRFLGKRLAMYSFVGVSFAAGAQMNMFGTDNGLTGFNEVCNDIQNMFSEKLIFQETSRADNEICCTKLDDLIVGDLIAANCQAAIFEAKLKTEVTSNERTEVWLSGSDCGADDVLVFDFEHHQSTSAISDISSIENGVNQAVEIAAVQKQQLNDIFHHLFAQNARLSTFVDEAGSISDIADDDASECSFEIICENDDDSIEIIECESDVEMRDDDGDYIGSDDDDDDNKSDLSVRLEKAIVMAKEHETELADMCAALLKQNERIVRLMSCGTSMANDYDMALKVMWVTDSSIGYAREMMMNELLSATNCHLSTHDTSWSTWKLPPHFNVEPVIGGFMTSLHDMKNVINCREMIPHVDNWQQDIALCVVTKRYEFTLAEFLASHELGITDSVMLMLQLLESVVHLGNNNLCHRDLKSDNVFVEMSSDAPHLLVANFGSNMRFDGTNSSFLVPCFATEITNYGYSYLTAPEVVTAWKSSYRNYTKADLWACGAIGYEIFHAANPFSGNRLSSSCYNDSELPDLPNFVPALINGLIKLMLKKDPNMRPEPVLVADVLHVMLWAPNYWASSAPTELAIRRWLIQFAAVTYCKVKHRNINRRASVIDAVKIQFLSRASLSSIVDALQLLHDLNTASLT